MMARLHRTLGYGLLGFFCGAASLVALSIEQSSILFAKTRILTFTRTDPAPAHAFDVWGELYHWWNFDRSQSLWPGLIFGLVIGGLLWRSGRLAPLRAAGFAAASTLAYMLAYAVGFDTIYLVDDARLWRTQALAGLLGGGVLAGFAALLLPSLRQVLPIGILTATGAILGATIMPILTVNETSLPQFFLPLWQGGYAAAFGAVLPDASRSSAT